MTRMPRLEMIGTYEITLPTLRRRVATLVSLCLAGALVALASVSIVSWSLAMPVVLAMALLAGISSLWSP